MSALILACPGAPAFAADLTLRVADQNGDPLDGAVVQLIPQGGTASARGAAQSHTIDQSEEEFLPLVTLVQPGDSVSFRNSDAVLHHVYSFAPIGAFEMVVDSGADSAPFTYGQPGIAAIGCNIHDNMIAYVVVAETPLAAITGPDGTATLPDAPGGAYVAALWHPRAGAEDRSPRPTVNADGAQTLNFALTVAPESSRRHDHGGRY